MSNLEKERGLFEEEFKKINSNIVFWLNTWDDEMQGYNHKVMSWIWHMWQASANREGYKLVPVECTDETAEAIASVARCCGGIAGDIYCAVIKST